MSEQEITCPQCKTLSPSETTHCRQCDEILCPAIKAELQRRAIKRWVGEGLRRLLLFPVLRLFAPIKIEGSEHLTSTGPYIFAANHSSHLDAPVVLAALPGHLRMRLRVAAAADYFFNAPWKGMLVSILLNAFAFERQGPGCKISLHQTQRLLRAGQSILIFPEGTRSPDGHLQPFKRGVGVLALGSSCPIIPVYIQGTHEAFPKGARWPRRQHIVVRFGEPLRFSVPGEPPYVAAQVERAVSNLAGASCGRQAA